MPPADKDVSTQNTTTQNLMGQTIVDTVINTIVDIANLSVTYRQGGRDLPALRNVNLTIERGQTYGLVGESGSGKSTLALALMHYLADNASVSSGHIRVAGQDILQASAGQLRDYWLHHAKLVPQNPLPSMNPSLTVGVQMREALMGESTQAQVLDALAQVGLADPARVYGSYPHQLSGGMQQRVMIAMALAGEPDVLVMDEPTTNLDVTTEATILDLVRELTRTRDTAVLYVSHSLAVVSQLCDRVAVMYAGELVEDAPTRALYARPYHPYSQALLDSVPRLGQEKHHAPLRPIRGQLPPLANLPSGCLFKARCPVAVPACDEHPYVIANPLDSAESMPEDHPHAKRYSRCFRVHEIAAGTINSRQDPGDEDSFTPAQRQPVLEVRDVDKRFVVKRSWLERLRGEEARAVQAVDNVSIDLAKGETLGLVGESGSGKSTLARCIMGLYDITEGKLTLAGVSLATTAQQRDVDTLKRLQMVFQSSDEALNPYMTVAETLRRPLYRLAGYRGEALTNKVHALLAAVKLPSDYADRLPNQLSGGEKQRVAIARALAAEPDLLLFDESVSGLDVSVQAAIVNLLNDLQHDKAYLFISHDLSVVSYLADKIAVMYLGHIVEIGDTRAILTPPYHPYTEALLSAVPSVDTRASNGASDGASDANPIRLSGDVPSPLNIPSGCRFHTRCPRFLGDICKTETPPWRDVAGKRIHCHIPAEDLLRDQKARVILADRVHSEDYVATSSPDALSKPTPDKPTPDKPTPDATISSEERP